MTSPVQVNVPLQISPATGSIPTPVRMYYGGAISRGTAVYISGWNAANAAFAATKADADAAGRSAKYVCMQDLSAAGMATFAPMDQQLVGLLDTSGGAIGDPVYLSATAGLLTLTPPTGDATVQIVGTVVTVSATTGIIQLFPQGALDTKYTSSLSQQGPLTVTSASANALAVGPGGTTNPILKVDASATTAVNGVVITGKATGTAAIIDSNGTDGLVIMSGATHKLAFFGGTPVARAGAYTQTYSTAVRTVAAATAVAVVTTPATMTTPYGYAQAQADAIVTNVNALVADVLILRQLINALIDDEQGYGLAT